MMKLFFNVRKKSLPARQILVILVLFFGCAAFAVDAFTGRIVVYKVAASLQICVMTAGAFLSSLWDVRHAVVFAKVSLAGQILLCLEGVSSAFGFCSLSWDASSAVILFTLSMVAVSCFAAGICRRVMNLRLLAKDGTVWGCMELCIESFNVVIFQLLSMTMVIGVSAGTPAGRIVSYVCMLLIALQAVALTIRVWRGSLMVIMSSHEDAVMESLKISQVEVSNGARPAAYRELYDRILEYFERDKPFLNSSLTISDVVQVVFSNKSYISRVISSYTGRNFRQFVNYYRVAYAITLFRKDPGLNITKLSMMSGFNSVVSFNMAFRLFMDENPSEWCRKERYKILKKKK